MIVLPSDISTFGTRKGKVPFKQKIEELENKADEDPQVHDTWLNVWL